MNNPGIVNFLIVGAGGLVGSICRYAAVLIIDRRLAVLFPFGTLAVNVVGSFVLGIALSWLTQDGDTNNHWKLFIATGFCGGFTTFSAFAAENFQMIQQRAHLQSLLYILISIVAGFVAFWLGYTLAQQLR